MSVAIYNDSDADISIVRGKRLAFIGYSNQGAAQAGQGQALSLP